jgi:hypothetical protein
VIGFWKVALQSVRLQSSVHCSLVKIGTLSLTIVVIGGGDNQNIQFVFRKLLITHPGSLFARAAAELVVAIFQ